MIRNIKIYGEKDKIIGGGVTLDDGWITIEGFSVLRDKELLDSKNQNDFESINYKGCNRKEHKDRIKDINALKVGDTVYANFYGKGAMEMKIESISADTANGKVDETLYATLKFGSDYRKCWVCTGFMTIHPSILKADFKLLKDGIKVALKTQF